MKRLLAGVGIGAIGGLVGALAWKAITGLRSRAPGTSEASGGRHASRCDERGEVRKFNRIQDPTFIDVFKLLPGDIILTRPREKDSKIIAAATLGQFSHAQIVFAGSMVVESTYDDEFAGVRTFTYPFARIKRKLRTQFGVCEISDFEYFDVFRYKARTPEERGRLEAFRAQLSNGQRLGVLGEPYASPQTLAVLNALATGKLATWVAERIASAKVPDPPWEGLYCSQLVLLLFREAYLPLFDKLGDELPDVTPNGLAQCERVEHITNEIVLDLTQREIARVRGSAQAGINEAFAAKVKQTEILVSRCSQREKIISREDWLNDIRAAKDLFGQIIGLLESYEKITKPARYSLRSAIGEGFRGWLKEREEARVGALTVEVVREFHREIDAACQHY